MLRVRDKRVVSSTLDGVNIRPGMDVGDFTRQADKAIGLIQSGDIVIIEDHHEGGKNRRVNEMLFHKILERLRNEHPELDIVANRNDLEIYLKQQPK